MPATPAAGLDLTRAMRPARAPELEATHIEADSIDLLRDLKLNLGGGTAGSLGTLDHYDVRAVIGQGGMGIVFRAYDQTLKRTVAIKVLNPRLSSSELFRRRFPQEAVYGNEFERHRSDWTAAGFLALRFRVILDGTPDMWGNPMVLARWCAPAGALT